MDYENAVEAVIDRVDSAVKGQLWDDIKDQTRNFLEMSNCRGIRRTRHT